MRPRGWQRLFFVLIGSALWLLALRADAAFPPGAACCTVTLPGAATADVRVGVLCLDYARRFPRPSTLAAAPASALPALLHDLPISACVVEPGYLRWALLHAMEQGDLELDPWPAQLAAWFLSELAQGQHTIGDIGNDSAWHFDAATSAAQKGRAREIAQFGWNQFQSAGGPPACEGSGTDLCAAFDGGTLGVSFASLAPADPAPHGSEPFRGVGTLRLTNRTSAGQTVTIAPGIGLPTGANNQRLLTYSLGRLVVTKFRDRNGNGTRESGELWDGPPVTVTLSLPRGQLGSKRTDTSHRVAWDDLTPSEYTVAEVVPAGYCATTPNPVAAVVRGNQTTELLFGNRGGDLEVYKWDDRNGNGQPDTGEPPLAGVTVALRGPGGWSDSRVTGADGYARWYDLVGGSYTASVTLPPGVAATTPTTQTITVVPCQTVRINFACRFFLTHPKGMAVDEQRDRLFIAYRGPEVTARQASPASFPMPALAFVDAAPGSPTLHRITRVVTDGIGGTPIGVAFNPATNIVYVASFDSGTVAAVDGTSGAVVRQIDPSGATGNAHPIWLAIHPQRNHIYVTNYGADSVAVIDGNPASPTFHTVIAEATGFAAPWGLAADPTNDFVYVGDREMSPYRIRVFRDTGSGLSHYHDIMLDGDQGHPPVGAPYVISVRSDANAYRLYFTLATDAARAVPDRVVTLRIGKTVSGAPDPQQYTMENSAATADYSEGGLFYNPVADRLYATAGGAPAEPRCDPAVRGHLYRLAPDGGLLSTISHAAEAIQRGAGSYTFYNPFAVVANSGTGYIYIADRCLDEVLVVSEERQATPSPTPTTGTQRLFLPIIMRAAAGPGLTATPTPTAPAATATVSATATTTPTLPPLPTVSATLPPLPTVSATPPPTPSATPGLPTATATGTPSATGTTMPTATATGTPSATGTAMPTATPTATGTPPPTITATATATPGPTCTQLLLNPSFETTAGWQLNPGAAYTMAEAHSGARSAQTGASSGYSSVQQSVTIPAGAASATLRVWYVPPQTTDGDFTYLSVRAGATATLFTEQGRATRFWRELAYDLTSYRGRDVTLFAGTYNNGAGITSLTFFDDITLTICQ